MTDTNKQQDMHRPYYRNLNRLAISQGYSDLVTLCTISTNNIHFYRAHNKTLTVPQPRA